MAPSSIFGRAGRMRIILTAVLAVAAVGLFLAPTGAFPSNGSHTIASLDPRVAATPVAPGALHGATGSETPGTTPSAGRAGDLTLRTATGVNSLLHAPAADLLANALRNPSSARSPATLGTITPSRPVDVGALLSHPSASKAAGVSLPTSYVNGWNGINGTESGCGCVPPDPSVAVGPTAVTEVVQGQFYFYDRSGDVLGNVSMDTFWGAGTDFVGSPYILYDNLTDRWITTAADTDANTWMLGVSDTSDPMGYWTDYPDLPVPATEDVGYPSIGVSQFMVGIALDDWNTTEDAYESNLWVVNYTELQEGVSASYADWNSANGYDWDPNFNGVQGLTESPSLYFSLINPTGEYVMFNITGAPPATPDMGGGVVEPTGPYASPEAADQYGTGDTIWGGLGQSIDNSFAQNGLISVVWDAWDGTENAVRYDQAWEANETLWQDYTLYITDVDLMFPAMAIDSRGDATFMATYSNSNYYPSLFAWGQVAGEPLTYSNGYGTAAYGTADAPYYDFGYYATGAIDPLSSVAYLVGDLGGSDPLFNTFIFAGETDPISVGVSSAPIGATDVGISTTFTATANGGAGTYSYNWTSLPPGCTNSEAATVVCSPSTEGGYTVSVNASDEWPQNATGSMAFTVNPLPTVAVPTASKAGADVGQTVTFTSASPVGGTPGFTYAWTGLPAGCGTPSGVSVQCTFTTAATVHLSVNATDTVGGVAGSPALTYTVSPALTIGLPTATPASVNTGASTVLAVSATGGSGGDSYVWSGLPTGCSSSNAASITCVPSKAGTYNVTVTVTDSNGASAVSTGVKLTVTSPSTTGFLGLSGDTGYILLGVIALVVVVLLVVLLTRRKKPSAAPTPWQGGAPPAGAGGNVPAGAGGGSPPPPPPPSS